jgi:hypothetical protein
MKEELIGSFPTLSAYIAPIHHYDHLRTLFRLKIFPKDVVRVKKVTVKEALVLQNFVKSFALKRLSLRRDPTELIVTTLIQPDGVQNTEKRRYEITLPIMHQYDKIYVPMHHIIVRKNMASHQSIPIPCKAK